MSDAARPMRRPRRSPFGGFGRRYRDDPRAPPQEIAQRRRGGRLFRKYTLLLVALVAIVLVGNAAVDFWFSWGEEQAAAGRILKEQAKSAARRIAGFIDGIEKQIAWTTIAQWAASPVEQRSFDFVRLLRVAPAITSVRELDSGGHEQLEVSRLAMDVVGSGRDFSHDPAFLGALAQRVWYGPVYFRKQSEPYMTLAMASAGPHPGVTVAEVNLKLIWDVVSQLSVGRGGGAFVVDGKGRLIADPDISRVLRETDLAHLPQVAAALAGAPGAARAARNLAGTRVLSAYAAIPRLGWFVFVQLPLREALAPLYAAAWRAAAILVLGLALATLAALFLARRMVVPIRAIAEGAARLGEGDLDRRITVATGDELEDLAGGFNRMAGDLQKSHAELETRVVARTAELQEALAQQTATAEVLQVINASPGDLAPVFEAMLEKGIRLCEAAFGVLCTSDGERLRAVAMRGVPAPYAAFLADTQLPFAPGSGPAQIVAGRRFHMVTDFAADELTLSGDPHRRALVELGGARTGLAVPLRKDAALLGLFLVFRPEVRPFTEKQIALLENFAAQAVIAIENARLLGELRERTAELGRSVDELRALSEVGQAVSSTLDLSSVLSTILSRSVGLTGADAGAVFRYNRAERSYRLVEAAGLDDGFARAVRDLRVAEAETAMSEAAARRAPIQLADLNERPKTPLVAASLAAGLQSVLMVPLVGPEQILGAMVLQRRAAGEFPPETIRLMQTLASQSVLAIQNARLYREIADKSEQLALASAHKSQFLANMSHELRTPLNAILGYAELLVDGIYGALPEKAQGVLERVQNNGKHLLALINDVLDLSKIEAGQLTLTLEDYSLAELVRGVVAATEPLAAAKGLKFTANIADSLPAAHGDARRVSQILLNLVGNAVKFTVAGEVEIAATAEGGQILLSVRDTGPGIAEADQERIFGEFQQIDNANTRKQGGTGLGLAISKRMVEMQGGRISVESRLGEGSTFRVVLPVRVEPALAEAAQ